MRWKIVDWRGRRYCGVGEELAIGVVVVVDAEAVDVQEGRRPTKKAAEPWSGQTVVYCSLIAAAAVD